MPLENFISSLDKIANQFKALILSRIQGQQMSNVELARLVAQIDFFRDLGLEQRIRLNVEDLFTEYDSQITEILKFADQQNIRNAVTVNRDLLDAMKVFKAEELLGKASGYASQVKNQIMSSLITGKPFNEIKKELSNVNLTSSQLNTALSTGFSNYGRVITALAYEGNTDKKFLYYGSIIETSSKQCTWLLMNQNMEGYTKAVVDAGVETPYGTIFWNGRVPNFNCDDRWMPRTDLLVKTITEFQNANRGLAERVLSK